MTSLFFAVFGAVFVAELAGDKTLYTLFALASRFRLAPILAGAVAAFMLKMLAAVLLGAVVAKLPAPVLQVVNAVTFLAMAFAIWRKKSAQAAVAKEPAQRWHHSAAISFAAIFFPEWGDPGQVTAAVLTAEHGHAILVWIAAVLAMLVKAALAATLGLGLRRWIPSNVARWLGVTVCLTMGVLAALRIEL